MDIDVFISYHVSTSKQVADALCNYLEASGIKVWYAPRDVRLFYSNDIFEAILACKIFILLLNPDSSKSIDCINEIQAGVQRLRDRECMAFIPFRIMKGDISHSAHYYLDAMNWIDAVTPPLEARIEELTQKIKVLLGSDEERRSATFKRSEEEFYLQQMEDNSANDIRCYAPIGNENFVGRKQELEDIHGLLEEKGYVFIHGVGGIGKSELIRNYIAQHRNEYKNIVWTTCEKDLQTLILDGSNLLKGVFVRKQNSDGESESDEELALRKLQYFLELAGEDTLWIIDNFDIPDDPMLEDVLTGKCKKIFTTRTNYEDDGYVTYHLQPLSDEDQKLLFGTFYHRRLSSKDYEALEKLFTLIDGHTLTIELFARIAVSRHMTPEKLHVSITEKGFTGGMSEKIRLGRKGMRGAYDCIRQLFSIENMTDDEKRVLQLLSMLPIEGYYYTDFMELAEIEDYELVDNLIRRSWLKYDPVLDRISMHPLICEVVRQFSQDTIDCFEGYIRNLGNETKRAWFMGLEEKRSYAKLVNRVIERFPDLTFELRHEYISMAGLLITLEQYEKVQVIYEDYLQIHIDHFGSDSLETIMPRYRLGDYYYNWSQEDKAYGILEEAIEIGKRVAPDSYELAYTEKHLSWLYLGAFIHQERVDELLKDCRRIYERLYLNEPNEPQIASLEAAYATLCSQNGKAEEGLAAAEKSYRIFHFLHGDENADTLAPMAIKSVLLAELGRKDEAIAMIERVILIQKKLFGERHHRVFSRYETFARIYEYSNDIENACKWYSLCKTGLEEVNLTYRKMYKRVAQKEAELKQQLSDFSIS